MRILHVIAGAPTGGAETFAQDAIEALANEGVEQHVVCRPHVLAMHRYSAASVSTTALSFSPQSRFLGGPRSIRCIADAWRADLVHAWMARAASFIPGGGIHGRMSCPVLGWLGGYYDLKYYQNVDCLAAVTPDICQYLRQNGAPSHRTFLCHTFGTLADTSPVNREKLNTPSNAVVLLVLSRMHHKKGIDTALQALSLLPGVYLWLAGDGPEMLRYETLSQRLGLSDRVRFLGWRTDRKSLLEAADICLLPSRYEPFGTVIAEAWSVRRPLIATPADGARQYVRDGEDGVIFPFEGAEALARAVVRISSDKAFATRLCDNGFQKYERLFSRSVVVRDLLATYRKAMQLGLRRDELFDVADLSHHAVATLARHLRVSVPDRLKSRVAIAAQVALAYYSRNEGHDSSIALDAGLLELTGTRKFIEGCPGRRQVRVLNDEAFDSCLDGVNLTALRLQNAPFVDALAFELDRPSW
ncbi:MAG: glycosyltransferase [Gammaproteobacteria bacterium]